MAPPKIIELRITGCLFSDSHFYRLGVDTHETELQTVSSTAPRFTKVLHVQLPDGTTSLEMQVFALVDGSEKVVAKGAIPVTPGKDFVHYDMTIPTGPGNTVTGIVKVAYKVIKLNAMQILRETVSGKSVLGLSINSGLVGDGADASPDYRDVRIKIKDKEGNVIGNNKISSDKSNTFFQLDDTEVFQNENGLELFMALEGLGPGVTQTVPLHYGTMSFTVPMSGNLALLITAQLLYEPPKLAGIVHEVDLAVLKASGSNEKQGPLKGNDYGVLNRKNLLFMQFANPSGEADVALPDETVLKAVHGVPFDRSSLSPAPDGFFLVASEAHTGRSTKKKALLKKNLVLHLGTFAISPALVADPSVHLKCLCSLISVNAEIAGGEEVSSLTTSTGRNNILGKGMLEERERERSRESGTISVVLEGTLTISGDSSLVSDAVLVKAMKKQDTHLSVRVIVSIVPTESPPLLSPTGELMPLSPPESPRLDEDEAAAAAISRSASLASGGSVAPLTGLAAVSNVSSHEMLKPALSNEQFLRMEHPNDGSEMPGQWNMQMMGQERSMYGGEDIENWGSPGGLGDHMSPIRYKIDRASTALVSMIKSELVEKQRLIDRLVGEASARTDAIELCGREIRTLREEALSLQIAARTAESALRQRDEEIAEASRFVEDMLGSPEQLNKLSRNTLLHIAVDLGERYQKTVEEKEELKQLVAEAQAARMQFDEDKRTLSDLQDAHMEQSRLIQKLQKKLGTTDTYKSTIKLQERVIAKMQAVIEAHLRTTRQEGGPEAAGLLDRIMQDLDRKGNEEEATLNQAQAEEAERAKRKAAEEELRNQKAETAALKKSVRQLEFDLAKAIEAKTNERSSLGESDANRKIDQLEAEVRFPFFSFSLSYSSLLTRRLTLLSTPPSQPPTQLTAAGYRINALEDQLKYQAKESAHEIARLRTKLFEIEMENFLQDPDAVQEEPAEPAVLNAAVPSGSAAVAAKALNAAAASGAAGGGPTSADDKPKEDEATAPPADESAPNPNPNPEETGTAASEAVPAPSDP